MINVYILKSNNRKDKEKLLKEIYKKETNKEIDINKITYNKYGKPYYKDFYFNISYSKNYIAVATSSLEIGIDIEEERTNKLHGNLFDIFSQL